MSYRDGDTPDTNMRSYMCMRAFPYEIGGEAQNIEAHKWLNAMRKDGWHLVSMSTSIGKFSQNLGAYAGPGSGRTVEGNIITFVMEGTKPDPQHGQQFDVLLPIQDVLQTTTTYGDPQW